MFWFAAKLALADDWPVVYAPGGMPFPGEIAELRVRAGALGGASFRVSAGSLAGTPTRDASGETVVLWRAPAEPGPARLELTEGGRATLALPISVRARPVPTLIAEPDSLVVPAGQPFDVLFSGTNPPAPSEVEIVVSEGSVTGVERVAAGLVVRVSPGPERMARVVAVGVLDQRLPGLAPAWAAVRLRARHGGTVTAEPGSRLQIRVSGRNYGPFIADSSGAATVSFDAYPGETAYELAVSDDLGNTQRLSNPIPSVSRPTLAAIPRRGGLFVGAWDSRGHAVAEAPACRAGALVHAAEDMDGASWAWSVVPAPGLSDVGVSCAIGDVSTTLRVPMDAPVPTAIGVRVYPEVLSTDFPLAEVQVTLADALGERLSPAEVKLSAARGQLQLRLLSDAIRAEYDGRDAAPHGGDEILATWDRPPGNGAPHRVALCGSEKGVAVARVLDARDRPLAGVKVALSAVGPEGTETSLSPPEATDARGFSHVQLSNSAGQRVRARSGHAEGEALAGPGAPARDCLAAAAPGATDLSTRLALPIRSGRVRQLFLEADPATLALAPGATATVRVRMLDAAGALVTDEPVVIEASEGAVSVATVRPDGTVVATFTPGPGTGARAVRLTATAGGTSVATTLDVVPRPVRGSAGAGVGYLSNLGAVESPVAWLAVEHRLPFPSLALRVGAGIYGLSTSVTDEVSESSVPVELSFFPVDVGVVAAQRDSRWNLGAGISVVMVPYALSADFGEGGELSGPGLAPPGARLHGEAGYRLGQAELYFEAGYLLFTAPAGAVTLSGNAGGLFGAAGYRVLY